MFCNCIFSAQCSCHLSFLLDGYFRYFGVFCEVVSESPSSLHGVSSFASQGLAIQRPWWARWVHRWVRTPSNSETKMRLKNYVNLGRFISTWLNHTRRTWSCPGLNFSGYAQVVTGGCHHEGCLLHNSEHSHSMWIRSWTSDLELLQCIQCISIYIYNYVGLYIMHYIVIQRRFSSLFSAQIRPAKALIWPCEPMPRCGRISDRQEDGRIWNAYGMLSIISLWQRLRWHHSPSNTKHTPWIKSRREFTEFTFHTDILVVLCCIMLYSDSDSCPVDSALDHWRRLYWSFDIKWYRLYW